MEARVQYAVMVCEIYHKIAFVRVSLQACVFACMRQRMHKVVEDAKQRLGVRVLKFTRTQARSTFAAHSSATLAV